MHLKFSRSVFEKRNVPFSVRTGGISTIIRSLVPNQNNASYLICKQEFCIDMPQRTNFLQ